MGQKILPVYKITINPNDVDDTGVNIISLVNQPAIESNFIAFSKDLKYTTDDVVKSINDIEIKFSATDNDKHIITGAVLIPNKEIYRNFGKDGGEQLWVFDAQTIEIVRDKYHRNQFTSNVNLEHQTDVDGCYVVESYIVNKDRGIYPKDLEDITDGTWIVSMKIDNNEVWEDIKVNGFYKGFSIQGFVNPIKTEETSVLNYSTAERYNYLLNKIRNKL
jgi:hypothetical protein